MNSPDGPEQNELEIKEVSYFTDPYGYTVGVVELENGLRFRLLATKTPFLRQNVVVISIDEDTIPDGFEMAPVPIEADEDYGSPQYVFDPGQALKSAELAAAYREYRDASNSGHFEEHPLYRGRLGAESGN